eukprot:365591-Chlamydomonas_euryale.AAC.4
MQPIHICGSRIACLWQPIPSSVFIQRLLTHESTHTHTHTHAAPLPSPQAAERTPPAAGAAHATYSVGQGSPPWVQGADGMQQAPPAELLPQQLQAVRAVPLRGGHMTMAQQVRALPLCVRVSKDDNGSAGARPALVCDHPRHRGVDNDDPAGGRGAVAIALM